MQEKPSTYQHKSIRLKDYDYSQAGAYFVTICTAHNMPVFGQIVNGKMKLNRNGSIVNDEWLKTSNLRENIELDKFIVMPNHFHGIIILLDRDEGTARRAATAEEFRQPVSGSLPSIVRSFKSAVTRQINMITKTPGKRIWQRNYYEHVIRNENDLTTIRKYIVNNPLKWESDRFHIPD